VKQIPIDNDTSISTEQDYLDSANAYEKHMLMATQIPRFWQAKAEIAERHRLTLDVSSDTI
jgi:hypothetical protein